MLQAIFVFNLKLKNKLEKMTKKLISSPISVRLAQIWATKFFS